MSEAIIGKSFLFEDCQWIKKIQEIQSFLLLGQYKKAQKMLHDSEKKIPSQYREIIYSDLGFCYYYLSDLNQSEFYFEKAHDLNPGRAKTILGWSGALCKNRKIKKSLQVLEFLSALESSNPIVYSRKISCAIHLKDLDLANYFLLQFEKEKEFDPGNIFYFKAKSKILFHFRKYEDLFCFIFKNFKNHSESVNIFYYFFTILFYNLKFSDAWFYYIEHLKLRAKTEEKRSLKFIYSGKEKNLNIYLSQGVGDQVFFSYVFKSIESKIQHEKIQIYVDGRMVSIFKRSFCSEKLNFLPQSTSTEDAVPIEVIMASQIRKFEDVKPKAYLKPNFEIQADFKKRYQEKFGNKKKIGISWVSGNPHNYFLRTIELAKWKDILNDPELAFISLQYGAAQKELDWMGDPDFHLYVDPSVNALEDLDAFSAQVSCMDLVITIDNSTVHFAGALGQKVWCLLSDPADWRWFQNFEFSKWYPDVKLYRQKKIFGWDDVLEQVKIDLIEFKAEI